MPCSQLGAESQSDISWLVTYSVGKVGATSTQDRWVVFRKCIPIPPHFFFFFLVVCALRQWKKKRRITEQMGNAALAFVSSDVNSAPCPSPCPALPPAAPRPCKLARRWAAVGQSPAGSALGAAHRTFGLCSKPRISESSEATDSLGGVRCHCGIFSAELPGKVSTERGSCARLCQVSEPESQGARERYALGLGHRGAARASWPGAGGGVEGQGATCQFAL